MSSVQRSDMAGARTRGSSRAVAAVVTGVGMALALAGCSGSPGLAVAGDRTITQAQLVETQEDLSTIIEVPEAGTVLWAMTIAPIFIEAAADNGIGVSMEDAREAMAQNAANKGIEDVPAWGDEAVSVFRMAMSAQAISEHPDAATIQAEASQEIADLDLEVNPRYGTLDTQTGQVAPLTLPWIVAPTT